MAAAKRSQTAAEAVAPAASASLALRVALKNPVLPKTRVTRRGDKDKITQRRETRGTPETSKVGEGHVRRRKASHVAARPVGARLRIG